ncbi:hypothetical protein [Mangrovimonas sp. DI 80]|uniref:hypothetical protein n=1 Tax=Mangrovimonas sp. DI 80 TaxID=1779330 RepID=UPI00097893A4|nr:hypothetical protein [Mangrovimonas sp. DI 80]OMP32482.1 hypothetical protein BKM32_05410 [Mangrovimonas sp. DI 80]
MKTRQLLLRVVLCTTLLLTSFTYAKTWRVNNQSNFDGASTFGDNLGGTPSLPVFKQIEQAVTYPNVVAGDTLHVEGSIEIYDRADITKQLVIIGPGYFLTENANVSNNTLDAKVRRIDFKSGSEGSQLIGMNVARSGSVSSYGVIYVNVNGVIIKRCRIEMYIRFATKLLDVYILQNFFSNSYDTNALAGSGVSSFVPPQEIIFNNNICQKRLIWSGNWGMGTITECNNNVFDGPVNELSLEFNTGSFQNNILKAAGIVANINSGTNNNVQYNTVSNATVFEGTLGNVYVPNMVNLFIDEGRTTDGAYQLKASSTYNETGSDGAERGAFGGVAVSNRYNLSGLGAIPVIYRVATPGVSEVDTGLSVTLKARTNN